MTTPTATLDLQIGTWADITDRIPDGYRAEGRTAYACLEYDPDRRLEDTTHYYDGDSITPEERARYLAEDHARAEAWRRDEWWYVGVVVEIRQKTATNWAVDPVIGRASIWGVESDSGAAYFGELAEELIGEACLDAVNLARAVADLGVGRE